MSCGGRQYHIVQCGLILDVHNSALAAGEYVAAEKLENDFGDCKLVEQIWVYGNSYEVGGGALKHTQPARHLEGVCRCC